MRLKPYHIGLFLVLLLFASCSSGDKECSRKSDCGEKACHILTGCDKGQCIYKPKENCCGNNDCEEKENSCSCAKDCGKCEDKGKTSSVAEFKCVGDKGKEACTPSLKEPAQLSTTDQARLRDASVFVTFTYDNPFLLGFSLLNVKYELKEKDKEIKQIKIKKVKVFKKGVGKALDMVGELDLNQVLFDETIVVDEYIPLNFRVNPNEKNETTDTAELQIITTYEYTIDRGEREEVQSSDFTTYITQKITVVNPGITLQNVTELQCNSQNCNDQNACTTDKCANVGGFQYCVNEYKSGDCCGNKVCDQSESVCSCPSDCGTCERDFGEFISFICSSNQCVSSLKSNDLVKQSSYTFDADESSYFTLQVKSSFNQPLNVKKDKVHVDIIMRQKQKLINLTILEIKLVDGEEIIGESTGLSTLVTNLDQPYGFDVPLTLKMVKDEPEEKIRPQLQVLYRYSANDGTDTEPRFRTNTNTQTFRFEELAFIAPEFP